MNFDVAVCHPDNRLAISCNTSSAVLHVSWQNISGDSINVQLSGNCILDNFTIMVRWYICLCACVCAWVCVHGCVLCISRLL